MEKTESRTKMESRNHGSRSYGSFQDSKTPRLRDSTTPSFKNLEAWKLAKALCVEVYRETSDCNDYGYRNQLTRSALSVPSNIAEGTVRVSDRETLQFLSIARGSAAELETQVLIGQEIGYFDPEMAENWLEHIQRIQKFLFRLIKRYRTNLGHSTR